MIYGSMISAQINGHGRRVRAEQINSEITEHKVLRHRQIIPDHVTTL